MKHKTAFKDSKNLQTGKRVKKQKHINKNLCEGEIENEVNLECMKTKVDNKIPVSKKLTVKKVGKFLNKKK